MLKLVKPAADRRVRDPADPKHRPLPEGGKVVTWSAYWHRRELDKDVTVEDPPETEAKAPAAAATPPRPAPAIAAPPAPPAAEGKA